ncbi:SEC-C metal-binding domain-containing protein [Noviherbaspirillum suwonense]|uniref:SEC-C motif-containing protein n=1 Tax=Noviherbaspirillum suwonense TaxID=1224511 RepID=A0ABY1QS93_9BURK|nr:SEC-C metal-binding domain-containing protein [Noviherbaspirillum suwonense]SMP79420.1 SEC-C motif-containing protein [Noviherbaspirillum suwonense]
MNLQSTTPAAISPPVRKLCREVAGNAEPRFIPVRGDIDDAGLAAVPGWAIWQCGDALIEAEFHVARRTADGELVDIASRPGGEETILFVEDPRRSAGAPEVDRERRALRRDPLVEDFITLGRKQFLMLHAEQPADPSLMRRLAVAQLIVKNMLERGLGGDDACLCNSGKRYKNCHGKAVRSLRV